MVSLPSLRLRSRSEWETKGLLQSPRVWGLWEAGWAGGWEGLGTLAVQQGGGGPGLQPPQGLHAAALLQVQQLDEDDRVDFQQAAAAPLGRVQPSSSTTTTTPPLGAPAEGGASWAVGGREWGVQSHKLVHNRTY